MPTKRHTSAEKFTQFLVGNNWQIDPRLRANMQKLLKKYPDRDEESWFEYFLTQARQRACALAPQHLQAYLEEVCYNCARNVRTKFKEAFKTFNDYLNEYLQDVRLSICDVDKFWRKYNPQLASPHTYAQRKLEGILTSKVFADQQDKPTSRYGSLVRVSKKYLKEALGLEESLSQYLIVHSHLKDMKAKLPRTMVAIKEPTAEQFAEIAQLCQSENNLSLSPQQVKTILETCIKALEDKRPKLPISLDRLMNNQKLEDQESRMPELRDEHLISSNISKIPSLQPLQNSRILSTLLGETIESLDDVIKKLPKELTSSLTDKLLILSYGFIGIKQKDIGKDLGVEQYEVSRILTKVKKSLIKELINLAKQRPHIKIDIEYLNALGDEIEDLLTWYYRQQVISKELENALRSHSSLRNGINILSAYFGCLPHECANKLQDINLQPKELDKKIVRVKEKLNLRKEEVARKLQITAEKVLEQVDNLVMESIEYLSNYFWKKLNLSVEIVSKIKECLHRNVYVFLCNAPYGTLVKIGQ
jgi:predicted DNA-binding protein (UPF0251 family)/CRP-like cAMP-binding protein